MSVPGGCGARLATLLLCGLVSSAAFAERRLALLVGENAGDRDDPPLRYAESDARAMRDLLVQVGRVAPADAHLLAGANASELRAALGALAQQASRDSLGAADRLVIYVSGHAAAGELHLRGSHFPLRELKEFLEKSPAGVTLLVLDTCESGLAIRPKGAELVASRVVIEEPALAGRIVIASAGPEESSFESDELGGSLFTQHFIAGLRGAADSSHDGRVSLQEAYAYAYSRTVDSAAASASARQTPIFGIALSGAGELVLSEPSMARAQLALEVPRPGEWTISSLDGSARALRFSKGSGEVTLALEPGELRLRTRDGDAYFEKTLRLGDGERAVVREADLSRFAAVPAGRKGSGTSTTLVAAGAVSSGAVSGLTLLSGAAVSAREALDATLGEARPILSLTLSQLAGRAQDHAFTERETSATAGGGLETWFGPCLLRVLGEAGAVLASQVAPGQSTILGVQPRLGASVGASVQLFRELTLDASLGGGGVLVHTMETRRVQPYAMGSAGLGWTW